MIKGRNALSLLLPVIAGLIICLTLLNIFTQKSKINFNELALGKNNTSNFGVINGVSIHCQDLNNLHECLDDYHSISKDKVILWFGNSQFHAINQKLEGDVVASVELHSNLKKHKNYLLTFSQPNANLQEHYLLFEYLLHKLTSVSTIILPLVFDDMRDEGIRTELSTALDYPQIKEKLTTTDLGQILLAKHRDKDAAGNKMAALIDTQQEKIEESLNTSLESNWEIWGQREGFRSTLYVTIYRFRNWLFNISPSTTRRMIPGRYAVNRDALKAILASASKYGIKVLLYIVPLRNDLKVPYNLIHYENFKKEMESIASQNGVQFSDFENIVPSYLWGLKNPTGISDIKELDFMHFQAGGHKLLATAIYKELLIMNAINTTK